MQSLILLRHAKAVRPHEASNDRARGLTERGRREAAEAGAAIESLRVRPAVALVSATARTRESWEIARTELSWEPRVLLTDAIYAAEAEAIWREAAEAVGADETGGAIVVGHNPGLHELVARLLRQARDNSRAARLMAEHLPTSGFAAFVLSGSTLAAAGPTLVGWGRLGA
jgi:phosphohistidine phosphatase